MRFKFEFATAVIALFVSVMALSVAWGVREMHVASINAPKPVFTFVPPQYQQEPAPAQSQRITAVNHVSGHDPIAVQDEWGINADVADDPAIDDSREVAASTPSSDSTIILDSEDSYQPPGDLRLPPRQNTNGGGSTGKYRGPVYSSWQNYGNGSSTGTYGRPMAMQYGNGSNGYSAYRSRRPFCQGWQAATTGQYSQTSPPASQVYVTNRYRQPRRSFPTASS